MSQTAIDSPIRERNRFVRNLDDAVLAEYRVIPRTLLWCYPTREAGSVGILDHTPHSVLAVVVPGTPQNSDSGVLHPHDGRDSSGCAEFEYLDRLRLCHRISVQGNNLKLMTGPSELGRAGIQYTDAARLCPRWLTERETLAVHRESLVTDLPSVGLFLLWLELLRLELKLFILFAFLHLFSAEKWLKFVCCMGATAIGFCSHCCSCCRISAGSLDDRLSRQRLGQRCDKGTWHIDTGIPKI